MNMNPERLRLPIVCDGCGGLGEIRARRASPEATCDLEECPDCHGQCTRYVTLDPGDPWAILRALRAFPLERDERVVDRERATNHLRDRVRFGLRTQRVESPPHSFGELEVQACGRSRLRGSRHAPRTLRDTCHPTTRARSRGRP